MGERQFGPYRLVQQVAVGGMAEIHLAKTSGIAGFEKFVALKMIHPNFSEDDQFIQMLIDEAKISVQLQHVNIAQTFDLGRVGDTYYITMEYVDGADLYKLLRRASEADIITPVDVAAYIGKEMANGLDYAHRKRDMSGSPMNIVHRDISPQNVLISHSGEVKLVDFGIAKATMRARQTAVGVIKGKYYYMSPEQAWGEHVDHRSDIFSAGIVLYESLVGQMLYLEEDLHKLLEMVRRADIAPPTSLRPDIPPQLSKIVMHALARNPDDRYQTASDMAIDLERFLHRYSPVFTATKVAQYFEKVLGAELIPIGRRTADEPVEPRDPMLSTQPIDAGQLARARSEFEDENSVIYRMSEIGKSRSPDYEDSSDGRRSRGDRTRPMDGPDLLDDIEESTVISGPPGFGMGAIDTGVTDVTKPKHVIGRPALDSDASRDYEPTLIESVDAVSGGDDEGPTMTHDAARGPRRTSAPPPPVPAAAPPPDPVPVGNRLRPQSRGMPAHPALAASTPTPSVSLLSGRRRAMTPAAGVPVGESVLSALVGRSKEPLPSIPQGLGGGQMTAQSFAGPAGMQQPPGVQQPQGWPQGSGAPSPYGVPGFGQSKFPAQPPITMSKQLAALEIDELPQAFRLARPRPRWILRTILASVCVAIGVVAALFFLRNDARPATASLKIESIPSGATIKIDGKELADKTPYTLMDAKPGTVYSVELSLPGHTGWSKEVDIRGTGGEVSTVAFLKRNSVKLSVRSTPPGAEVFIGGSFQGRTPIELSGLSPEGTRVIEVRAKGFRPETRDIEWGSETSQALEFTLQP